MRIVLGFIAFALFACESHTASKQNNNLDSLIAEIESKVILSRADTSYTPLIIKFGVNDSILIRRKYYVKDKSCGYNDLIFLNDKLVYVDSTHAFVYESKYNRVIDENDSVLLFLESDGSPNFNFISAYSIVNNRVAFISDCVFNDKSQGDGPAPFTDIDNDGFLEYGGFNLTEHYGNDSMYYIPSQFYEIKKGKLFFDSTLTVASDIEMNGVYIKDPLNSSGYCCVLVPRPKSYRE